MDISPWRQSTLSTRTDALEPSQGIALWRFGREPEVVELTTSSLSRKPVKHRDRLSMVVL